MKILHVWDVAGVASILAKWQTELGHETKVLMQKKHDPMHITSFYNPTYDVSKLDFVRLVLKEAKDYDIIHVHNISEILPLIKIQYPKKPLIIHHHGFTSAAKKFTKITHRFADKMFVATPDLLKAFPKAILIPTPIDTDHFCKIEEDGIGEGKLAFHMRYLDLDKFKEHVKDNEIEIVDREKLPVPYKHMPEFFRTFATFYDIKYLNGILLKAYSKGGLEALACGLDVIGYDGETMHDEPLFQHRPEYVATLCLKHYGIKEK